MAIFLIPKERIRRTVIVLNLLSPNYFIHDEPPSSTTPLTTYVFRMTSSELRTFSCTYNDPMQAVSSRPGLLNPSSHCDVWYQRPYLKRSKLGGQLYDVIPTVTWLYYRIRATMIR